MKDKNSKDPVVYKDAVRRVILETHWFYGVGNCMVEKPFTKKGVIWTHSEKDKKEYAANKRAAARKARGLPAPDEIARIRMKLGLSQRQASEILTGSLHSFQKYEAGTVIPSFAMGRLLDLLDRYPTLISR